MASGDIRKMVVRPATRPNSDINVTPLVDVVLVLLIIFMVLTPLLEKDILVRVPQMEEVQDPQEVPPDQLVVSVSPEGEFSINQEKIPESEYVDKLKRVLAAKPRGERLVFFMADDKSNYGKVVTALDGARVAGAETLGMMTEVPPHLQNPEGGGQPGAPSPGSPPSGATPPGTNPPSPPPGG
jgi:biopolymer transport protein ExbD